MKKLLCAIVALALLVGVATAEGTGDSEAELRVRWEDEDSAVLYAANPGPYDKGEFTVKCK